jgi:hypothetical protein
MKIRGQDVLDSGVEISLMLIPDDEKLFNAPRFDSIEEATKDAAVNAVFGYW